MTAINLTLRVMYSCAVCGLVDRAVDVRVRGLAEDVVEWMERAVIPELGLDHLKLRPECRTTQLSQVKIPYPHGAKRVGDPAEN